MLNVIMSQGDEIKPEFKTIRIPASSYYKLVELTGMLNVLTGLNFSIAQTAAYLIENNHEVAYPEFKKLLNKPTELKRIKSEAQQSVKQVWELIKDVKILE